MEVPETLYFMLLEDMEYFAAHLSSFYRYELSLEDVLHIYRLFCTCSLHLIKDYLTILCMVYFFE